MKRFHGGRKSKNTGSFWMRSALLFTMALLVSMAMIISAGCSKSEKTFDNLEDLKKAKIGSMTGTTSEAVTLKLFPEADYKSFADVMDAVAALKSGQLDAVVTVISTAANVAKYNPELTYLPYDLTKDEVSIAIRKEDAELLAQVDNILTEMKKDGTLADMRRRRFKKDLGPYETVDIKVPQTGKVLRVGTSATREPFAFVDANGKQTGHDGELAYRIAEKLGRPLEFYDSSFPSLIPALQSGKIDMIITGMAPTEERKKLVSFSQSYFDSSNVVIVKKPTGKTKTSPKMSSVDDIATKRVGVFEGSIQDGYVKKNYPKAQILTFTSLADMGLALKNNKADVAFVDDLTAQIWMRTMPEIGILADGLLPLPTGVGFNKSNPVLRDRFNQFLKDIKADGTYDQMVKRWMEGDPENVDMPGIQKAQSPDKLVLGITINNLPFATVKNNEYVGFDIEMMQRFALWDGKKLEIISIEFPSLIAALSSGKVDLIAASINITEERQKQIDFSDTYLVAKSTIIALKSNLSNAGAEPTQIQKVSFLQSVADSFYSNIILENRYLLILDGLKTTVVISLLSSLFGTLLGGLICFMRMSKRKVLSLIAKVYISILRGTPVLVLLMLIFYVVFASVNINPLLVAVLAFGMNFAAYASEVFRTGIEGVERGQTEAGIAMGFSRVQTFLNIIAPQALRRILPVYKGEFISMVKMTSIVGYIAVQDLTKASDIIRSRTFDAFFPLVMVAILYFAISGILIFLLDYIERKIDPKRMR